MSCRASSLLLGRGHVSGRSGGFGISAAHVTGQGEDLASAHLSSDNRIMAAQSGWVGSSAAALHTRTATWLEASRRLVTRVGDHATDLNQDGMDFAAMERDHAERCGRSSAAPLGWTGRCGVTRGVDGGRHRSVERRGGTRGVPRGQRAWARDLGGRAATELVGGVRHLGGRHRASPQTHATPRSAKTSTRTAMSRWRWPGRPAERPTTSRRCSPS